MKRWLVIALLLGCFAALGARERTVYRPFGPRQVAELRAYTKAYDRYRAEVAAYWRRQQQPACERLLASLGHVGLVAECGRRGQL